MLPTGASRLRGLPVVMLDPPDDALLAAVLVKLFTDRQLGVDARRVAVEHNLNVVKRAQYDSTSINDGDQVEIVNFVGGGLN